MLPIGCLGVSLCFNLAARVAGDTIRTAIVPLRPHGTVFLQTVTKLERPNSASASRNVGTNPGDGSKAYCNPHHQFTGLSGSHSQLETKARSKQRCGANYYWILLHRMGRWQAPSSQWLTNLEDRLAHFPKSTKSQLRPPQPLVYFPFTNPQMKLSYKGHQ